MSHAVPLLTGLAVLALMWHGPLADSARVWFSSHMTVHIGVVAIAAPLVAVGIRGSRFDPVHRVPAVFAPVPASIVELIVVWGWHAPLLHEAARAHDTIFAVEQGTFLGAGLLLWLSAVGDTPSPSNWRAGAGVGALLFTSIHMTLLGALFLLAPRPLYLHVGFAAGDISHLADQHLGGAIMLLVGGASYLLGALWLTVSLLRAAGTTDAIARGHDIAKSALSGPPRR
jgi:putative membrane protein